jgi:glucose/arabinose dehydrogenase
VSRRWRLALRAAGLAALAAAGVATVVAVRPPSGDQLPRGLVLDVVGSGLTAPTAFRFSPDGRIFVAEKSGRVMILDGLGDTTPKRFADLSTNVHDIWDRGLLGLALHPHFPREPYVYVSYTHNAKIGGEAPLWPTRNGVDTCPDPPGALEDGCVASGRLSVLTAKGDEIDGPERVLIEDWCQQSNTHSVADLQFGEDGALYMSAGDGAFYEFADYGQRGVPVNPCGDPPGEVGTELEPPTAEGGLLRAQDLRTEGDPVTLDGTVIRVDPRTGQGLPDNPLAGSSDPNARRIVAYGFKQPFRFTIRPGTDQLWIGEVGESQWEEIDRTDATDSIVENFGWPCYEGPEVMDGFEELRMEQLDICRQLYADGPEAVTAPFFTYSHAREAVPNDRCFAPGSSISGLAFVVDGPYPGELGRSLYFADASRGCIWALPLRGDGLPEPSRGRVVIRRAGVPVDLQVGPDGRLYYADLAGGRIVRIRSAG